MSSRPRPFPDVADPRTPDQRERDLQRLAAVVTRMSSAAAVQSAQFVSVDNVIEQVLARRAASNDGLSSVQVANGVAFEPMATTSGRNALVVTQESVFRRPAPPTPGPPGGPTDGPPQDPELARVSPELAARLRRVPRAVGDAPDLAPPGNQSPGIALPDPDPEPELDRELEPELDPGPGTEPRERLPGIPPPAAAQQSVLVTVLHMTGPVTPTSAGGGGGGAPGDVIIKSPGGATGTTAVRSQSGAPTERGPIVVAVIDTGITAERRADGWLTEIERPDDALDPLDAFPAAPPPANGYLDLGAGHGTFVAGIIRQVDPLAQVRIYRAMDSEGFGSEFAVAAAMVQAARDGAHVINLSLGTESLDGQPPVVFTAALDAIDELRDGRDRPAIVAAAGNSGDTVPVWPAASDRVIAVAGLTTDGAGAPWSSRGSWVNVSTIGQGVVSTYVEGTEDPAFVPEPEHFPPSSWAMWTGTSFAAPQISGAISRMCREQDLTPQTAADRLIAQGEPLDEPGFGVGLEFLPGT